MAHDDKGPQQWMNIMRPQTKETLYKETGRKLNKVKDRQKNGLLNARRLLYERNTAGSVAQ